MRFFLYFCLIFVDVIFLANSMEIYAVKMPQKRQQDTQNSLEYL